MVLFAAALLLFAAGEKEESLLDYARASQGRFAYGMYIKGKKAGWTVDEIKVAKKDRKDVVVTTSEMLMDTLSDGVRSVRKTKTTVTYATDGEGAVVAGTQWNL